MTKNFVFFVEWQKMPIDTKGIKAKLICKLQAEFWNLFTKLVAEGSDNHKAFSQAKTESLNRMEYEGSLDACKTEQDNFLRMFSSKERIKVPLLAMTARIKRLLGARAIKYSPDYANDADAIFLVMAAVGILVSEGINASGVALTGESNAKLSKTTTTALKPPTQ